MHFTWDISLGQIMLGAPLATLAIYMLKIHKTLLLFRIEHEELMRDWAARQNPPIRLSEMPTRQKAWF